MEEDLSHQDNAFADQTQDHSFHGLTQSEPPLSPQETEILPTLVQTPPAEPQILSTAPKHRRSSFIKGLVLSLLVLLLLLAGTGSYALARPHIPGGSALVRITPDSQQLSRTFTTHVTLGSTDPALNSIGAHTVSMTTAAKSLTIPATGSQQEPATYASGVLGLGDGNSGIPIPVGEYSVYSNSGVEIEFYVSSPIPDNHNIILRSGRAEKPAIIL